VAKSIYLRDPDGIGLELTVELPDRVRSIDWPPTATRPDIIDAEGRHWRGLEELDVEEVLAERPDRPLPRSLPPGAYVGHVHLQVSNLKASYAFYRDRRRFIPTNYVPVIGYGDLGTGDFRIHRIAVNTWERAGVRPRPADMAGTDHFTLHIHSASLLNALMLGLADAGR
jgi:catechol 2,3-dioxygenase